MNGIVLETFEDVSGGNVVDTQPFVVSPQPSENGVEYNISPVGGSGDLLGNEGLVYDEELGGYPVVIVNDVSEDNEIALYALPDGSSGYQVSDYWLNYFRGVLYKHLTDDYLIFATRETSGNGYNYITHYWMYVGDLENGGDVTVYDCYSENSISYVDISTESMSAIDVDSYDTLVYSNLGNVSDIRNGGGVDVSLALLFFLGFFAVYAVCRGIFDYIVQRIYRK